jgi:hypothetical protein
MGLFSWGFGSGLPASCQSRDSVRFVVESFFLKLFKRSQALQVQVQVQVFRISDSFGYLQRSLQGLFVGLGSSVSCFVQRLYIVCGDSKEESETYYNVRGPAKSLSLRCS